MVEGGESINFKFGVWVDVESGEDGGKEIFFVKGILDDFGTVFVGGSDKGSTLDASTGHGE